MVGHLPHHSTVKGLSPVADDGNGEEKIAQNQKRLH